VLALPSPGARPSLSHANLEPSPSAACGDLPPPAGQYPWPFLWVRKPPWVSLSLFSSRGPMRLKPFKFNYPQGFFSHR